MAERIFKQIIVHGTRGSARVLAIIDTGTPHSLISKELADEVGAVPLKTTGKLNIAAGSVRTRLHEVEIEIPSGSCSSRTKVLVPEDPRARVRTLVGSLYLQKVGATIRYKNGESVFCGPEKLEEDSWMSDFIEDRPKRRAKR
jgi:predicted aspartyl protease